MTDPFGSTPTGARHGGGMRFHVDSWDPAYGTSDQVDDLAESSARIDVTVERTAEAWAPVDAGGPAFTPSAVLFVDGVRRIEARVWVDEPAVDGPATDASMALAASYAAGVVCCCSGGAHHLSSRTRRGLFTVAAHAVDVATRAGVYTACHTPPAQGTPVGGSLSLALQRRLAELELAVAVDARNALAEHPSRAYGQEAEGDDLLVVDGPLRGRTHLPRALGFIKTHRTVYLPPTLHAIVGRLRPAQRTPVFLMGTSWDRHAWYLRLPCRPGSPWTGVVRLECSADLPTPEVVALANASQRVLCRYASVEYKDTRAPQNLVPIAGLERELRRQLGDPRLLARALRAASAG